MLEDLFIADIFFIYLIIPVKKIFQSLGDKNGYSHPLFYVGMMIPVTVGYTFKA